MILVLSIVFCGFAHANNLKSSDSLKKYFSSFFNIGAAINEDIILGFDNDSKQIVETHFNSITPENSLKWMFIQPSPNDNFIEGENYIMVIKIPQGCKLQSASQDGDLINGGCKLSNYTPTPLTLLNINTVARVAGTPLLVPATQFIGA